MTYTMLTAQICARIQAYMLALIILSAKTNKYFSLRYNFGFKSESDYCITLTCDTERFIIYIKFNSFLSIFIFRSFLWFHTHSSFKGNLISPFYGSNNNQIATNFSLF